MTRLQWGAATDVGRVRTNNEDSLLIEPPLFAVADGMGGAAAGEVASAIAVATLKAAFSPDHTDQPTRDDLADAVRHANEAIFERARQDPTLRGMGTTLTAVALVTEDGDDLLAVVNVGDSRAYRLRDGELEQVTEDHSLVEEMVRIGRLSADEAAVHPQRHIVTRALGIQPDVEVDCFGITPFAGDRFVLASDGLTDEVGDHDIASVLRRVHDPEQAARELVDTAMNHGGRDNVTVVVVDVVDDDARAAKASQAVAAEPPPSQPAVTPEPKKDDGPGLAGPPRMASTPAAPPAAAAAAAEPATTPRRRRVTVKAVVFILAVLVVLAAAVAAIGEYARGSFYVGLSQGRVAIYRGRPGGLLWFKPTVEQRTDLAASDVPAAYRADVQAGKTEASLAAARHYVQNLKDEAARSSTTTTTTPLPPDTPPTSAPKP